MNDNKNLKVLKRIQNVLYENDIKYFLDNENENLIVVNCDNECVELIYIELNSDLNILLCTTKTKMVVEESMRKDYAILISVVNNYLNYGGYDFDVQSGELCFRLTSSFNCVDNNSSLVLQMITNSSNLEQYYYGILKSFLLSHDLSKCISEFDKIVQTHSIQKTNTDALQVYNRIIEFVKNVGFRYKKYQDNLRIGFDVLGDDVPMSFDYFVDFQNQQIVIESIQPFTSRSKKKKELAYATCIVNNILVDGYFSFNWLEDRIVFRLAKPYDNNTISKEELSYMLSVSLSTVEKFNDRFLDLNKGYIKMKEFIELVYSG